MRKRKTHRNGGYGRISVYQDKTLFMPYMLQVLINFIINKDSYTPEYIFPDGKIMYRIGYSFVVYINSENHYTMHNWYRSTLHVQIEQ